jgi:hypothetical protein
MPRIYVPALGPLLRGWREAQRCRHIRWGVQLWLHGSHCSPWRMARILANAEITNQWEDVDPANSLGHFMKAARRALVHSSDDRDCCDDVIAACVRANIKHFDNDV